MTSRDRAVVALLIIGVAAAPVTAGLLVSRGVPEAAAALTSSERLVADSGHADSAAFAALPNGLEALLDIRAEIAAAQSFTLPLRECNQMTGNRLGETRRRLQLRFPDSSSVVLYAVGDESSGALQRVEFLRRTPRRGQRGFIWEARRDRTRSVWWFEYPVGSMRREERADLPRGGPVPRAVRALGRQLLAIPCPVSNTNSPTNPISGSRN